MPEIVPEMMPETLFLRFYELKARFCDKNSKYWRKTPNFRVKQRIFSKQIYASTTFQPIYNHFCA